MEIPGRHKKLIYLAYLAAAAVLFSFLLFPGDAVRGFLERNAGRINSHLSVTVGDSRPAFPSGVRLKDVSLFHKGARFADLKYVRVTVGIFSLLGKSPVFSVKSAAYDGDIKGKCRLLENRGIQADLRVSGLALGGMDFLNGLSQHRISGLLEGSLKADSNGSEVETVSQARLSEITVTLAKPVLGMKTIQFDTVTTEMTTAPRRIEIRKCVLKGPDIDGEFAGDVLVRQPFKKSVLNLEGTIQPRAAFIKKAGKTFPVDLFMNNDPESAGVPVKLSGTIDNPGISIR